MGAGVLPAVHSLLSVVPSQCVVGVCHAFGECWVFGQGPGASAGISLGKQRGPWLGPGCWGLTQGKGLSPCPCARAPAGCRRLLWGHTNSFPSIPTAVSWQGCPQFQSSSVLSAGRCGVRVTLCSLQPCSGPGSWHGALRVTRALCGEKDLQSCCPVSCWVTADPAAGNGQILWCQRWWQVTGEPGQAQLIEAISLS